MQNWGPVVVLRLSLLILQLQGGSTKGLGEQKESVPSRPVSELKLNLASRQLSVAEFPLFLF